MAFHGCCTRTTATAKAFMKVQNLRNQTGQVCIHIRSTVESDKRLQHTTAQKAVGVDAQTSVPFPRFLNITESQYQDIVDHHR